SNTCLLRPAAQCLALRVQFQRFFIKDVRWQFFHGTSPSLHPGTARIIPEGIYGGENIPVSGTIIRHEGRTYTTNVLERTRTCCTSCGCVLSALSSAP